jgi:hypothetical protein
MKKKNTLGLTFNLKFNTGTIARFIHNEGLENKRIRTQKFPAALQPGEILANAFGTCHCRTFDPRPKQWQAPNPPTN